MFLLHLSSFCNIHLNFSLTFVRVKSKCYNFENGLQVVKFIFFIENNKKSLPSYLKDEGKNVICTFQKTERLPHSSISNISHSWLILLETSRPKARSLGMKPKVCCRPLATITREVYSNIFYLIYLLLSYVFCHGHVSFGLNVIDHTLLQYHDQILYEPHS